MKKVCIVGFAPGFSEYPKDYEGEVWSLNTAHLKFPRIDRLFLADKISDKTDIKTGYYIEQFGTNIGKKVPIDEEGYKERIRKMNLPFVSCHPYPDVPTYEPYPIKEVYETFGAAYFANCIAYVLAYALLKGFEEIELWGVKQGEMTEYYFHKGSIEFWIGMAVGSGVNVRIMGDSMLLQPLNKQLYGYRQTLEEVLNNNK